MGILYVVERILYVVERIRYVVERIPYVVERILGSSACEHVFSFCCGYFVGCFAVKCGGFRFAKLCSLGLLVVWLVGL